MVLSLQYNNYIISLGKSKLLVVTEVIRDGVAALAIILTLPYIGLSTPDNIVKGVEILLFGQLAAAIVTWVVSLWFVIRLTHRSLFAYLADIAPYAAQTAVFALPCIMISRLDMAPLAICILQALTFAVLYLGINYLMKSRIQQDVMDYFTKKSR